ncbi:hypothetical protein [Dyadobacter sp. 676]|uniref:Response regulatory domain-containing protein n=1 Tax=Dyadobacter sp. 676 TaxID=3088362 RepID=A0AAU8FH94_9BACT
MKHDTPLKVLIFDMHPITRKGIRLMLENMALPMNLTEAAAKHQFYKYLTSSDFDLVILSVNEPGTFDSRKLSLTLSKTALLYTEEGAENAIGLMTLGAGACMSKKCVDAELRTGILAVLARRRHTCLYTRALTDATHQSARHFDIHAFHAQRRFI